MLNDDQLDAFGRDVAEQRTSAFTRGYSGSARPRNLGPVSKGQGEDNFEAPFPVNRQQLKKFLTPAFKEHGHSWTSMQRGVRGMSGIHEGDSSGRWHNTLAHLAHLHVNDPANFKRVMDEAHVWNAENKDTVLPTRREANQEMGLNDRSNWAPKDQVWGKSIDNAGKQRPKPVRPPTWNMSKADRQAYWEEARKKKDG